MTEARKRGRPAAGSGPDQRERILAVARQHLAAKGFAGSSLRAIAREAGVDPSLIGHYFGDKAGLLVATMELPFNPIEKIQSVLQGGPEGMAERLLTTFFASWDPHRDVFSSLIRTTLGGGNLQAPMLQLARNVLITSLQETLTGKDTELRASLVAGQLIGTATARYVIRLGPLADAPAEDVVRLCAPAMQKLIG